MGNKIQDNENMYFVENHEQLVEFSLGDYFPVAVPRSEGVYMDVVESGIVIIMQMPDTTNDEMKAFSEGIIEYSYVGTTSQPILSMWMLGFPSAIGMVEVHYNAPTKDKLVIEKYMEPLNGEIKNTMALYLLDGRKMRGIKFMELDESVVKGFHEILTEQLKSEHSYLPCNDDHEIMRNYTQDEIFRMGIQAVVKCSMGVRFH